MGPWAHWPQGPGPQGRGPQGPIAQGPPKEMGAQGPRPDIFLYFPICFPVLRFFAKFYTKFDYEPYFNI